MIRRAMLDATQARPATAALLTPMADVVFLLLVVLLLGGARVREGQIEVAAGAAGPAAVDMERTVFVAVRRTGPAPEYRVNDGPWIGRAELDRRLRLLRVGGRGRVVVDPGEGARLADATAAFDLAEAAGYPRRSLLTGARDAAARP